jgi:hypothetical protein
MSTACALVERWGGRLVETVDYRYPLYRLPLPFGTHPGYWVRVDDGGTGRAARVAIAWNREAAARGHTAFSVHLNVANVLAMSLCESETIDTPFGPGMLLRIRTVFRAKGAHINGPAFTVDIEDFRPGAPFLSRVYGAHHAPRWDSPELQGLAEVALRERQGGPLLDWIDERESARLAGRA